MSSRMDLLVAGLVKLIEEKAGSDIKIYQKFQIRALRDIYEMAIVATGLNSTHVGALSDYVDRFARDNDISKALEIRVVGRQASEWVIVDIATEEGSLIVHLFQPMVREYYQLDQKWTRVNLEQEEQDHV